MIEYIKIESALAELEATASLWLTWFLAFNGTSVTGKEALILEGLLIIGVNFDQCACDSETQGLALACETATVEVGFDVVFAFYLEQVQWLLNHILQDS